MELLLPEVGPPGLALPSYVKLDMAFGVGAGGQLFDKSRYRSHGAINGPDWAAGVHGYCLDFDPTVPDYVLIPAAHTQLNFTTQDFSIVARIRADTLPAGNNDVFNRGLVDTDGYSVFVTNTGRLYFSLDHAPGHDHTYSAAAEIALATWYTIGVSRSNVALVYKNGIDITVASEGVADPITCARSAKIGIYDNLINYPWDGKIEFLRIFGGLALSASEHLAWHNALA